MRSRWVIFGFLLAILAASGSAYYFLLWNRNFEEPEPAPVFNYNPELPLPPEDEFEQLAKSDPVAMYEKCLSRYHLEVKGGFHSTLEKTEWVNGSLHDPELVILDSRDEFAARPQVRMIWKRGYRKDPLLGFEIHGVLLAEEQAAGGVSHYNIQTYRPSGFKKIVPIGLLDDKAKNASRYCLRDAGVYRGMLRTYESWKELKANGELKTEFVEKRVVEKLGKYADGQPIECLIIRRTGKADVDPFEIGGKADRRPEIIERDGFTEVVIMIDTRRWLQVGTVIRRTDVDPPRLIGEYYFRDIELNPTFATDTFTIDGMKAACKP